MQDRHDRSTTAQDHEAHIDDTVAHQLVTSPTGIEHIGPFNVRNPNAVHADDPTVCLWPITQAAITISKIIITLKTTDNEVEGDLKYADAFIGLANPVVINPFDTTSGVLVDDSIVSGSVPAGKCIYLEFDSSPAAAITQMCVDIEFTYD